MKNNVKNESVVSNGGKKMGFVWKLILGELLIAYLSLNSYSTVYGQVKIKKMTYEQFIKTNVPQKTELDIFLKNKGTWAQFSPEFGYILGNSMPHDGRDSSFTISTVQANGARTQVNYKDMPCRINVYGDSFAQCHQVSDGETWEEILAANFGEPIRNFGMGGYGTYQSYRRLLKEESTVDRAKNIIFYIWGDDHQRSLLPCRYMAIKAWNDKMAPGYSFHGNFWPYLDFDLETGKFTEHNNKLNTPQLLYRMMDQDWMYENLKDNLGLQALLFIQGYTTDFDNNKMLQLARWMNIDLNMNDKANLAKNMEILLDKFGYAANIYILERLKEFALKNDKNLLIVIFDPYKTMRALILDQPRVDQEMVDYLKSHGFNYFDMNIVHAADYKKNNLSLKDYYSTYFVGHYDPNGNMFFARSIKTKLVNWLNPKPITHLNTDKEYIDFNGYLQGLR